MTQFFFDGLDLDAIRRWRAAGVVTGVTTNLTMLRDAGLSPHDVSFRALVADVAPHPVAAMAGGRDVLAIVNEGEQLAALGENVVVKCRSSMSTGATISKRSTPWPSVASP